MSRRQGGQRLMIYGAGEGGQVAFQELVNPLESPYRMLGFADDDRRKHGTRLLGYSVVGGYREVSLLVQHEQVDEIVVSTRLFDGIHLAELEQLCSAYGAALTRIHVDLQRLVAGREAPGTSVVPSRSRPPLSPDRARSQRKYSTTLIRISSRDTRGS